MAGSHDAPTRARDAASVTDGADPAPGAALVFTRRERLLLLAGFALLVVMREPLAWLHGRFMGEEGTVFLAFAWHRPAGVALWRSFAGYLNLGANATTLLTVKLVRAGLLPLELAPRLTMILALSVQLIPAVLILTGRGRWLANRWAVIACLLIIAISPMTEEVFANVLHIQFHLALAAALILALDIPASRAVRIVYWLPLLLAPLCGPGAIVILPLFALRALVDRDRDRLAQAIALGVGAGLQMLLFYTQSPVRGHVLDPATLANVMFVRLAAMPYISAPLANKVGRLVHAAYLRGGPGWWCITAIALAYFGTLLAAAMRRRDAAFWLVAAGLALAVASFGAGMLAIDSSNWFSLGSAERYNFLPLTLLGMGLVALAMRGSRLARNLCLLTLISGSITFFLPIRELREGPDWPQQVAAWQQDHDHLLATWPDKWLVDLSDHDRPCAAPGPVGAASTEPRYCEGNWLALVRHDSLIKAWQRR